MKAQKAKLKGKLEKALRRRIPQPVFNKFDQDGYIQDCLDGTLEHEGGAKENFQVLKRMIARELDYLKAVRREEEQERRASVTDTGGDTTEIELEPPHGSYMSTRAAVISEVWSALVDERPDVTEFRRTVLGENLLSPEEASTIVNSPSNALGELRALDLEKLGSILANDYYGWDEEGAVWYVLTGKAPQLRPIRLRARGKSPVEHYVPFQYDVTLSVLPWVHATEVEHAYRSAQKQLLEEPPRKGAPRTSTRVLEVVQFWWEQFRSRGTMPSWPAWYELWNQTHPDKKFSKWRTFREYFFRGTKEAQPSYVRLPQPNPTAEGQEVPAAEEYIIKAVQGYRRIGDQYTEVTFE